MGGFVAEIKILIREQRREMAGNLNLLLVVILVLHCSPTIPVLMMVVVAVAMLGMAFDTFVLLTITVTNEFSVGRKIGRSSMCDVFLFKCAMTICHSFKYIVFMQNFIHFKHQQIIWFFERISITMI
jgi:hypothetical protein